VNGNLGKRAAYTKTTIIDDPTPEEILAFNRLQNVICNKLTIYHLNPNKRLFLQIDGSLEPGSGVMAFHLKDGHEWKEGIPVPSTQIEPIMFLSR